MRIFKLFVTFIVSSLIVLPQNRDNEYYSKLNKSFEIYGGVFKILTKDYVVKIDPEKLMEKGIEGMLDALDPYTVYISENKNSNRLDALMSGSYTGFGISAGTLDSQLTVLKILHGSPNWKYGLRVGDKIYKIDTTVFLYSQSSELQKYSSGSPGTFIDVEILRDGIDDTLKLSLVRDKIRINGIACYKMLDDGIGYILISEFSRNLSDEFKTCLFELRKQGELKGLIIDVRDNPGGLLLSAVEICELFLPDDTPVVSTKGYNDKEFSIINTVATSPDTSLPLAVLINANSASASEILAAAMQDLDRAVIIGQRSFGKGLVQSVKELPYNGFLKITTSKYYMPSGRCIQRLDYPVAKEKNGLGLHHDSLFYTKNKRPVYESSGVEPDIVVKEPEPNDYQKSLLSNFCFFKFANFYTSRLDTLTLDFTVIPGILQQFEEFLENENCASNNRIDDKLIALKTEIEKTSLKDKVSKDIDKIIRKIDKAGNFEFYDNLNFIKDNLRKEILKRFYSIELIEKINLNEDNSIKKAISILKTRQYYSILSKPENKLN
jgi:carboxyl-terminal processing protease